MNIIFDSTITLGQVVHLVLLCGFLILLYRASCDRLRRIEDKTDALLKHSGLNPRKFEMQK